MDPQDIGPALYALRTAAGMRQQDVAGPAAASPSGLSHVENGKTLPSVEYVLRVLAAMDCTLWDFAEAMEAAAARRTQQKNAED